ncbi:MAG: hypothetical protein Q8J89_06820 [Caulobacter sp.]|nr:hypothetical protein [Caulobacter sp.]
MSKELRGTGAIRAMRSEIGQLAIVAIVLAVGASVTATGIVDLLTSRQTPSVFVGLGIVALGLAAMAWRLAPPISDTVQLNGVILLDEDKKIARIDRYEFSEDIRRYLSALKAENKALGRQWESHPLQDIKFDDGNFSINATPSGLLAVESVEYFFLDKLSTHLTDYFNKSYNFNDRKIYTLARNSLPISLFQNRFVDLFSRPMEDRETFESHGASKHGRVVYALGKDGAIFDAFELTLPKGGAISRLSHGCIRIETDRFILTAKCSLANKNTHIPFEFRSLYAIPNDDSLHHEEFHISVNVKFKILAFLSGTGWQYYRWLDSFVDSLREAVDFSLFLKRIGWEQALTSEKLQEKRGMGQSKRRATQPAATHTSFESHLGDERPNSNK